MYLKAKSNTNLNNYNTTKKLFSYSEIRIFDVTPSKDNMALPDHYVQPPARAVSRYPGSSQKELEQASHSPQV